MKTLKLAVLTLACILFPVLASAQTALTATTTSALVSANANCFALASVTGISGFGPGINNPVGGTSGGIGNITDLYIDRELLQVVSVNTAAKQVCTLRGQGGSQASPHISGSVVWIGPPAAFLDYDPEGYCGGASGSGFSPANPPQYTPWINQRTSQQWLCSSVTSRWVPGFGNPGVSGTQLGQTASITGATPTASGPLEQFTGTTALVTLTTPTGLQDGASVTLIFTGSAAGLTWTAAGNIAVAGTSTTAGSTVTFVWDATAVKWRPSRLA